MEHRHEHDNRSDEGASERYPNRIGPFYARLSPALTLFREAVLRDPQLQDQLRDAGSCGAVAEIANNFFRSNFRLELLTDLKKTPLRGLAEDTFREMFRITPEELEQHILYQTNDQGEFLLGESELQMVAGSARLADSTSCYGCSCGNTCALAKTC